MTHKLKVAYLSLQEVAEGLDSWAAVNEIIVGLEDCGLEVDRWFPRYGRAGAPGPLGRLAEMARLQWGLIKRLNDYDAIYVRGHQLALWAAWGAARRGIPVVQECNGMYEDLYLAWPGVRVLSWLLDAMQRKQYSLAQRVVCVTPELARWVESEAPGASTVVIPNGASLEVFRPDAPRRPGLPDTYAVFFGNFAPWQGLDVLIDAFENPKWPEDMAVVVVGQGALEGEVKAAAVRHPGRFIYLGHVPYHEVSDVVANAVLSIVPLHSPQRASAGFSPLKLYESMACATPLIVSDTGGLKEIVNQHECGASFASGNAEELARVVAERAADATWLRETGRRARDVAERECSWSARAKARAAVLEEVVGSS